MNSREVALQLLSVAYKILSDKNSEEYETHIEFKHNTFDVVYNTPTKDSYIILPKELIFQDPNSNLN